MKSTICIGIVGTVSWLAGCAGDTAIPASALPGITGIVQPSGSSTGNQGTPTTGAITLTSPAFANNGIIPALFTADNPAGGVGISPPLAWTGVPNGTQSLAILAYDLTVPTTTQWLIYNISPTVTSLPQGIPATQALTTPISAVQGPNTSGGFGYLGPNPTTGGTERYSFTLYALDTMLTPGIGLNRQALLAAMQGHILAQGQLIGTYTRGL